MAEFSPDREEKRFGELEEDELLHLDQNIEIAVEVHRRRVVFFDEKKFGPLILAVGPRQLRQMEKAVF